MASLPETALPAADTAAARPPGARGVEDGASARILLGFLAANLLFRLALIPVNTGAYTDGVLQVTQASEPTAIWPPLYGWLVSCISWIMSPLYAGRLISALAGALGVIPLWMLARRAGGRRAAFFAALLYTVAPVSLRWSARMMTDALFSTLFWAALERWDAAERRAEGDSEATGADGARVGLPLLSTRDGRLAVAVLFVAAATLTRYQGVILLPLLAVSWVRILLAGLRKREGTVLFVGAGEAGSMGDSGGATGLASDSGGRIPWRTPLAALALLIVPVWAHLQGIAHGQQFAGRLGPSWVSAVTVIALNAEAFLLLTPYFLTYPVALWAAFGLLRGAGRPAHPVLAATLYVGVVLLLLQGAFSSFQERYLMPLYGLLWVWAGIGLSIVQGMMRARPRAFSALAAVTLVWSAFMALSVVALQRQAFGDFVRAGEWLRDNAAPETPVFSTELYNADLGGRMIATNKIRFFSGRDVTFLPPPDMAADLTIPPGSLICIHSSYPYWREEDVVRRFRGQRVFESDVSLLPLFPDVMEQPGAAQNPIAWNLRYTPQHFWTTIWRIDSRREPRGN